jgi:hypothetical protein
VADAHLAATRSPDRGGARLALTNPGGMRADLRCDAGPCEVRYADAFAAQPFGNSLVVMTLTGAQIVGILEQQFSGLNAQRARVLQPSAGFEWDWRSPTSKLQLLFLEEDLPSDDSRERELARFMGLLWLKGCASRWKMPKSSDTIAPILIIDRSRVSHTLPPPNLVCLLAGI